MGIAEDFHQDMLSIYEKAKEECNYTPTRFLETVYSDKPQEGLYHLWELGRLDLSMEVLVLKEKYTDLFTDEEKIEAKRRLDDLGYETKEGEN